MGEQGPATTGIRFSDRWRTYPAGDGKARRETGVTVGQGAARLGRTGQDAPSPSLPYWRADYARRGTMRQGLRERTPIRKT